MTDIKEQYYSDLKDRIFTCGWRFYVSDGENRIDITSKIFKYIDEKNILNLNQPYKLEELFKIEQLKKYNIGTTCHIGRKDMIYLGIDEFLYLIWYRLIKLLNILLRKQKP